MWPDVDLSGHCTATEESSSFYTRGVCQEFYNKVLKNTPSVSDGGKAPKAALLCQLGHLTGNGSAVHCFDRSCDR